MFFGETIKSIFFFCASFYAQLSEDRVPKRGCLPFVDPETLFEDFEGLLGLATLEQCYPHQICDARESVVLQMQREGERGGRRERESVCEREAVGVSGCVCERERERGSERERKRD